MSNEDSEKALRAKKPKYSTLFPVKIKRQPMSPKSVKVCPRCGSTNIRFSSKLDVWLTPRKYVCHECGYVGPIVLEIEKIEGKEEAGTG